MSAPALRLAGVRLAYTRGIPVLDGIDLELDPGRSLVLLGASGAGKSTLLRVIAGLERPDAGSVEIDGRTVSDPRIVVPPEHRGVGLVFQDLELWSHMTVAENIAFGLPGRPRHRRAVEHARVRELAERVGVAALLGRRPDSLSGGERQRVAIARTLAPGPRVVLYDEPLANLDPERRADLRRLIRTVGRDEGRAVVHVTHDPEEAMTMGDEIAVLGAGRVLERGTPHDLYRRPRSLAAARALGPVSVLPAVMEAGRAATALGHLEVAGPTSAGARWALLRPEWVEPGEGPQARVLDVRAHGSGWRFTASLDGREVLGHAAAQPSDGDDIGLVVTAPVAVIEGADLQDEETR